MLSAAGLTGAEESVYLMLVRRGTASVPQIARRLGVQPQRASRIVSALQTKGLVHRTPPPGERVVAVPPEVGLEALVQRRERELDGIRDTALRLASEAQSAARARRTDELVEIVQGRTAVQRAFERVQRLAETEVLTFVAPPYAVDNRVNTTELTMLRAGVSFRAVYGEMALAEPEFVELLAPHMEAGEQARFASSVPIKLVVADRVIAMLPLAWTSEPDDFAAMLVHPCGLLGALVALFEQVWARATPLPAGVGIGPRDERPGVPSEEDRYLLSLLVAGYTDEAVAARLGLSRRTVVRRVRDLMSLAGARSRMQLGWVAKELGWL